jgi:hypothetical protein
METILLQDWVSLAQTTQWPAGSGAFTLTQSEPEWIVSEALQDAAFLVEIAHATGTNLALSLETAPSADAVLFRPMLAAKSLVGTAGTSFVLSAYAHSTSGPPLAKFVRWSLSATASWEACLRITMFAS